MSSRAFSGLFAAALLLSLGAKGAAASGDPKPDGDATVEAARAMLADAGLEAKVRRLSRSPGILVEAVSGDCRLIAGDYPVHDTYAEVYQDLARTEGRLSYVHRGRLHDSPPKARSMLDYFWWRELRRIGIGASRAPVIALIASPGCDAAALPWEQAAFVPA
jgi:hypothetical protein